MPLNEGIHGSEFLLSEGNGSISREVVTFVATASVLKPGTLIGKITASGKYKPYADANSDGSQTAVGVLLKELPIAAGDQKGVIIARQAEVASARLTGSDANGVTDLAAVGIIVRS